jgi:hypothetical protein
MNYIILKRNNGILNLCSRRTFSDFNKATLYANKLGAEVAFGRFDTLTSDIKPPEITSENIAQFKSAITSTENNYDKILELTNFYPVIFSVDNYKKIICDEDDLSELIDVVKESIEKSERNELDGNEGWVNIEV